jgi:hypothetical protein
VVNRYINWTSIFFIHSKKSNNRIFSCSFFFQRAAITAIKKNFCLQSYCSAAPFVLSREFPQPINLLVDIVRLFSVYCKKKEKEQRSNSKRHIFLEMFYIHFLHSVPHIYTHKFYLYKLRVLDQWSISIDIRQYFFFQEFLTLTKKQLFNSSFNRLFSVDRFSHTLWINGI